MQGLNSKRLRADVDAGPLLKKVGCNVNIYIYTVFFTIRLEDCLWHTGTYGYTLEGRLG